MRSDKSGILVPVLATSALALAALLAHGGEPAAGILVEAAWIRWLPADVPGGGYMTVTDTGGSPRTLVGASSDDYAEVSMHQTRDEQGMSGMRPVASLTLAPGVPVRFTEGGYHLMLMQPRRVLHPGDRVVITLHFAEGDPVDASFVVRTGAGP